MKIEIKHYWGGEVLFAADAESLKAALVLAVKQKVDLRGADLRGAILSDADLSGADLRGAILSDADPSELKVANLDSKILAAIQNGGRLEMGDWHKCETTHCRAGWAITLCPKGPELEKKVGPAAAGALIYAASYPDMRIPNFYCGNNEALEDIRRRAATDKVEPAKK